MTIKEIFRLMYVSVIPFIIGAVGIYYLNKMDKPAEIKIGLLLLLFILYIPVQMILSKIGNKIFKENTLVYKMMNCELRMKHGYSYCAKCPDSYACATSIDNIVNTGNIDNAHNTDNVNKVDIKK